MIYQIGNIYTWSFVYNIVRVYSCKSSNVDKVIDSTVNSASAVETDLENHSKTSIGPEFAAKDISETNDRVTRLEIESTLPDGHAKVRLCSDVHSL